MIQPNLSVRFVSFKRKRQTAIVTGFEPLGLIFGHFLLKSAQENQHLAFLLAQRGHGLGL